VKLRKPGIAVIAAVIVCLLALAFWRHGGPEISIEKNTSPPISSVVPMSRAEMSPLAVSAQRSSIPSCDRPSLELTLNEAREILCLGSIATTQNGSVRSYELHSVSGAPRSLRIDASGTLVVAAFLTTDSTPLLSCRADACKGIVISKRDAKGSRTISLKQAVLTETAGGLATLSGIIEASAENLPPTLACNDQSLSMIASDGSTIAFCPKGGVGFEIGNDGSTTYRFTSLDNESLLVVVNPTREVQRVVFEGEHSLACQGRDCRQLQISDGRVFHFAGTSLIDTQSGESTTVLDGTLIAPPL
jgi:hypothetical protein